jgi:hypothetical protein
MIPTPEGLTLDLAALTPHLRDELLAGWERGEPWPPPRRRPPRAAPRRAVGAWATRCSARWGSTATPSACWCTSRGCSRRRATAGASTGPGKQASVEGGWLVDWRGARSLLPPAHARGGPARGGGRRGGPGRPAGAGAARHRPAAGPRPGLPGLGAARPAAARRGARGDRGARRGGGQPRGAHGAPGRARAAPGARNGRRAAGRERRSPRWGRGARPPGTEPAPAAAEGEAPTGEAEPEAEPWGAPAAREDLGQPLERDPAALLLGVGQAVVDVVWSQGDTHVLLPAAVSRNLALTLAAQQASPADRAAFIDNPLAFLPDAAAFDEAHYSARVIGLREAPKASGRAPLEPRTWATPLDGLLIELPDGPLWVPGEDLPGLAEALRAAAAAGEAQRDGGGAQPAGPAGCDRRGGAGGAAAGQRRRRARGGPPAAHLGHPRERARDRVGARRRDAPPPRRRGPAPARRPAAQAPPAGGAAAPARAVAAGRARRAALRRHGPGQDAAGRLLRRLGLRPARRGRRPGPARDRAPAPDVGGPALAAAHLVRRARGPARPAARCRPSSGRGTARRSAPADAR